LICFGDSDAQDNLIFSIGDSTIEEEVNVHASVMGWAIKENCREFLPDENIRCYSMIMPGPACESHSEYKYGSTSQSPQILITATADQEVRDFRRLRSRIVENATAFELGSDFENSLLQFIGIVRSEDGNIPSGKHYLKRALEGIVIFLAILPVSDTRAYIIEEIWDRWAQKVVYRYRVAMWLSSQLIVSNQQDCVSYIIFDSGTYQRYRESASSRFQYWEVE